MVLTAVPHDGAGIRDLSLMRRYVRTLSDAQLLMLPTVLTGSPRDMADTLRRYHEAYGPRYISVQRQQRRASARSSPSCGDSRWFRGLQRKK